MTTPEPVSTTSIRNPMNYGTTLLFSLITGLALFGVPAFAYYYGYSRWDWMLFGLLYVTTGLGITVGYHRLISHRSFDCPKWVKAGLLIAGGWALENSALKWAADHVRHHAHCDGDADPTTLNADSGTATAAGCSAMMPTRTSAMPLACGRIPS